MTSTAMIFRRLGYARSTHPAALRIDVQTVRSRPFGNPAQPMHIPFSAAMFNVLNTLTPYQSLVNALDAPDETCNTVHQLDASGGATNGHTHHRNAARGRRDRRAKE